MHVFLTGPVQIGKSTLITAALAGAEDCDLLLMDEIGRMERRAEG